MRAPVRAIRGTPSTKKNPRTGGDSKVGRTEYYANHSGGELVGHPLGL